MGNEDSRICGGGSAPSSAFADMQSDLKLKAVKIEQLEAQIQSLRAMEATLKAQIESTGGHAHDQVEAAAREVEILRGRIPTLEARVQELEAMRAQRDQQIAALNESIEALRKEKQGVEAQSRAVQLKLQERESDMIRMLADSGQMPRLESELEEAQKQRDELQALVGQLRTELSVCSARASAAEVELAKLSRATAQRDQESTGLHSRTAELTQQVESELRQRAQLQAQLQTQQQQTEKLQQELSAARAQAAQLEQELSSARAQTAQLQQQQIMATQQTQQQAHAHQQQLLQLQRQLSDSHATRVGELTRASEGLQAQVTRLQQELQVAALDREALVQKYEELLMGHRRGEEQRVAAKGAETEALFSADLVLAQEQFERIKKERDEFKRKFQEGLFVQQRLEAEISSYIAKSRQGRTGSTLGVPFPDESVSNTLQLALELATPRSESVQGSAAPCAASRGLATEEAAQYQAEIANLQTKVSTLESQREQVAQFCESLEQRANQAEAALAERDTRLQALQDQVNSLAAKAAALQRERDELAIVHEDHVSNWAPTDPEAVSSIAKAQADLHRRLADLETQAFAMSVASGDKTLESLLNGGAAADGDEYEARELQDRLQELGKELSALDTKHHQLANGPLSKPAPSNPPLSAYGGLARPSFSSLSLGTPNLTPRADLVDASEFLAPSHGPGTVPESPTLFTNMPYSPLVSPGAMDGGLRHATLTRPKKAAPGRASLKRFEANALTTSVQVQLPSAITLVKADPSEPPAPRPSVTASAPKRMSAVAPNAMFVADLKSQLNKRQSVVQSNT